MKSFLEKHWFLLCFVLFILVLGAVFENGISKIKVIQERYNILGDIDLRNFTKFTGFACNTRGTKTSFYVYTYFGGADLKTVKIIVAEDDTHMAALYSRSGVIDKAFKYIEYEWVLAPDGEGFQMLSKRYERFLGECIASFQP